MEQRVPDFLSRSTLQELRTDMIEAEGLGSYLWDVFSSTLCNRNVHLTGCLRRTFGHIAISADSLLCFEEKMISLVQS